MEGGYGVCGSIPVKLSRIYGRMKSVPAGFPGWYWCRNILTKWVQGRA
jgi:hypothetical protein